MTPERFQQIDQLYQAALDQVVADRSKFISSACAHDSELRREVESLLKAHEQAGSFIAEPALRSAARLLASDQAKSLIGTTVAHYRIESILGAGGMGEVYLALDLKLNRNVALKLLPDSFNNCADQLGRFEQEARAISALNHPNIVTIHEIGQTASLHFIATELVGGETLREHMTRKHMSLGESLDVSVQIASALQAAHEAGIVHRDIKPDNIMLRRDGIVKVLDFGLAKLTADGVEAHSQVPTARVVHTNPGVVMGTVGYMSPEQARGEDVDARTDIWSLGVVLYEMISGCAPFVGETPSHIIVSIFEHEPPPLSITSAVPRDLQRIVAKALTKKTEHRYQKVGDLLADLKLLKQQLEVNAAIGGVSEPEEIADEVPPARIQQRAVSTDDIAVVRTETRPAYFLKSLKAKAPAWAIVSALLLIVVIASFGYRRYALSSRAGSIRSIAVLPFENQTRDPNSDYLADGISETLINHLSKLPGVKVSARSSSFKYKGMTVDPQEVARALGVDAILTGRVSQRGENLVISVELIDARDKTQIWGEQYNRKMADVLVVQSDISSEIVRRLRLHLRADQQQQLVKSESINLDAYQVFLKGRSTWDKGGTENRKKAVEYYQQAIALDPAYALAYAQLSASYDILITNNELNPKEFALKVEAAARKALELDENLAEAHLAMARVQRSAWQWNEAENELKRAIELNSNLVAAHSAYAMFLMVHGKREEALAQLNHVRELDPLSPSANQAVLVGLLIFRKNDQALELAKKVLEENQQNPDAHIDVGELYARLGRHREAIAAYQAAIKLGDDSPDAQIILARAYASAGEPEKARAILKRYESGKEYCSPVGLAFVHLALGERERAFASLEAAYAAHDQQLIWLLGEWRFDELHSDPRFQDLARRVGLLS